MYLIIFQRLLFEALIDIVYFPLWWYTGGLLHALRWCIDFFKSGNETLAPGLWFANLLVPMYGQYDWEGRIISFFMRFAQVVGRSIALVVWLVVCTILFMAWLVFPALVSYGLIRSFLLL